MTLLYSCLSEPSGRWRGSISNETAVVSEEEYSRLLKSLGEYEQHALPQDTVKTKPDMVVSLDQPVSAGARRINKVSLFTVAACLAALILMIVYVNIFSGPTREAVAVMVNSVDARWAGSDLPVEINSNLSNYDGIRHLLRGCIQVRFFSGAEVIIEGPSEFEFKSFESMNLNSGRLYVNVAGGPSGFTVNTPCSRIVDLGTQFGVKVDFDGTSDLHMFKGRASISAGTQGANESVREVIQGHTLRVSPSLDHVQDIQVQQQMFVRHISSTNSLLWRGEPLDLANLASGGDGISKWGEAFAISPFTGLQTQHMHYDRSAPNAYVPIAWNPYVDGIFVPNGGQSQVVTSQGHLFTECPPTNGVFCSDLVMNQVSPVQRTSMVLQGVSYGYPEHPGIFMHANLGLTYNLERIRSLVPADSNLVFRSKIGVSETETPRDCDADFWVLVDGKVCYQKRNVRTKGLCGEIEVRLHKGDRFLTLVTTDGGTIPASPDLKQTDSDWCIFAEPRIEIE
jgi:hypothetical protein